MERLKWTIWKERRRVELKDEKTADKEQEIRKGQKEGGKKKWVQVITKEYLEREENREKEDKKKNAECREMKIGQKGMNKEQKKGGRKKLEEGMREKERI